MNQLPILFGAASSAGVVLLAGSAYAASTNRMQTAAEETSSSKTTFELYFDNGLLDAYIDSIPLGKVLHELSVKSGTKVKFIDPEISDMPVSVTLEAIPLEQGVKNILRGFSYMLYGVSNTLTVIVLSTEPSPARTGLKTEATRFQHASSLLAPDKTPDISGNSDPVPLTFVVGNGVPQSLDEFRPITVGEALSNPQAKGDDAAGPSAPLAQEQEYQEALLHRALDVLKSEHRHLYAEAINQLTNLRDLRATDALVEAVSGGTILDPKLRLQAVSALWQHAEDQHFADPTSVSALEHLTEDDDEDIRSLAQQALQHREQYQQNR